MSRFTKNKSTVVTIVGFLSTLLFAGFLHAAERQETIDEPVSQKVEKRQELLVDVNTADVESFATLKGIGEKKAQTIVGFREQYGPFTSIHQIKEVKGIGDKIFDSIKSQLTISKP